MYLSVDVSVIDVYEAISFISFIPHIRFACASALEPNWTVTEDWLPLLKTPSLLNSNTEDATPATPFIHSDSDKTLEVEFWVVLPKSAFQSLSSFTHLTVLRITNRSTPFIPVSYLRYVPKSLTDLKLGYLDDFPTAADFSTLPKCLRYLDLSIDYHKSRCPWKNKDLEALPHSLQFFNLDCTNLFPKLTKNITPYLPPYLMEMNMHNTATSRFQAPLDRLYPQNPTNPTMGQSPQPEIAKKPNQSEKPTCDIM